VLLLGTPGSSLAGSEYLAHIHGLVAGLPTIDLNAEALLQSLAVTLADQRLLQSAHDCSDGGLVVAVAESAILGSLGYSDAGLITSMTRAQAPPPRWDATLFGESPSRIVVTCSPMNLDTISERARESGVDITHIGTVGGDRFTIVGFIDEPLANLADVHGNGLERAIES
jgi:phosphoribosylformylglycinamidine synthase